MSKPGDDLEKIVEIIERSISPMARVEQNVFLPVLTSTEGHTAQCDIVIWSGSPPRETLTIVEVQDRNSKVDINDFRGWLVKIEDVGAQHLICVSRKEFPSSIKERVSQSGSKIFLVTLQEITPERIPLELIRFIFQYHHKTVSAIKKIVPYVAPGQVNELGLRPMSYGIDEKVWSLDGVNLISLLDICGKDIDDKAAHCGDSEWYVEGESRMSFNIRDDPSLYYLHNSDFIRIGLVCEYAWTYEFAEIPMSVASYEQNGHGALAWVFEATHVSRNGVMNVKLPLIKLDNGDYEVLESVVSPRAGYTVDIVPIDLQARKAAQKD